MEEITSGFAEFDRGCDIASTQLNNQTTLQARSGNRVGNVGGRLAWLAA